MEEDRVLTRSKIVDFEDLQTDFLSLRVGEDIPRLEIKEIRKLTNAGREGNLSGVDYKYIIESTDGKLLTVNSWILWKKITAALQEAGKIESALELRHTGIEEYSIRVI